MSNRFIALLTQMRAWDTLVLAAFGLAGGLMLLHHNIQVSRLPLIVKHRANILLGYWALVILVYLAAGAVCVGLTLGGN